MKLLLLLIGALGLLVALAAVIGSLLPREHVATRAAVYRRPPAVLYATVRDWAALPSWRSGVKAVEPLPASANPAGYREVSRHGTIPYVVLADRPGEQLVTRIADDTLPFGGTWTFEFTPADGGGRLRITENGFVKPPLFRFLSRFVFGQTATMETYLRDLGRKFGEATQPQP